jgi:hypothetical protein
MPSTLYRRSWLPKLGLFAILGSVVCTGCYNGQILVHEARSLAHSTRHAEIDLGEYFTTLPRNLSEGSFTELKAHIFVTVPRSRVTDVKRRLKADEYRLRHELLAAVRSAPPEELTEPSLARLRKRIEEVANSVLTDAPIKSVGFYDVALRRR